MSSTVLAGPKSTNRGSSDHQGFGRTSSSTDDRDTGLSFPADSRIHDHLFRVRDVLLAATIIAVTLPVWLLPLFNLCRRHAALRSIVRVGRARLPLTEYRFKTSSSSFMGRVFRRWHLDRVPSMISVLRGEISFVGPRPVCPEECRFSPDDSYVRYSVLPGMTCLWWLRQRGNVGFGREIEADLEYIESRTFSGDLGILLRSAFFLFFTPSSKTPSGRCDLFGIPIQNTTMEDAIALIQQRLNRDEPTRISFVNADCINIATRNGEYHHALQTSSLVFADGIGMRLAGSLLGNPIRENVNGTDMFPRLCQQLQHTGKRIYLLGAKPGTAERVASWMKQRYPGVDVCGTQDGYFDEEEEARVIRRIKEARTDLLLVAFGAPRQELWIRRCLEETGARVAIGVGGLFDFYGGNVQRAPSWMREIGLEWIYRLYQEPSRMWKRYLIGNWFFLARTLVLKIRQSSTNAPPDTTSSYVSQVSSPASGDLG
jgi:N-acetylglucosaminyldiphosphoundecaprenol N-acetyl-beta-D-mannosaminyltransferase